MLKFKEDRSGFPQLKQDGTLDIDLNSQKFVKIWQGPNHPGITGNMAIELTLSGDEIVDARTHVGYLYRAFEKLMERRKFIQCFPICVRMCVPEPDINEYLLAASVEDLGKIEVPEMAKWLRTLVLEMARVVILMRGVPGQAGTMGMGMGVQWGVYLRDLMLDRFEELTCARVYHMYIAPGGVRGLLPDGFKGRMEVVLKKIDEFVIDIDNLMFNNIVFKKRTKGVGVIKKEWIDKYSVVGPNARAAGVRRDVRKDYPYLMYDKLDFEAHTETDSDIYARSRTRWHDLQTSVDLIRQIMAKMPDDGEIRAKTPNVLHWTIPKGETYTRIESSRGEYGYYFVTDGSAYPRRIQLRGPSFNSAVVLLEKMLINANLADVSSIMVSLGTCPPEIER
jgi:NADH-quinone oxidoreductase subunit D